MYQLNLSLNDRHKLLNGLLQMMIKYQCEFINSEYFVNYLEVSISHLDKYLQAHFKTLIDHVKKRNSEGYEMDLPEGDVLGEKISLFVY